LRSCHSATRPRRIRCWEWPLPGTLLRRLSAAALGAFRRSQGAISLGTHAASLFGVEVPGSASLVDVQVDSATASPVAIVEWVTESGPRLWLVRSAEEIAGTGGGAQPAAAAMLGHLSDVTVTGSPAAPGSVVSSGTNGAQSAPLSGVNTSAAVGGLPTPSWWNGNCDTNTYQAAAGEPT